MSFNDIPNPKKFTVTFEIEVVYNSDEYKDTSYVIPDLYFILSEATRYEHGCLSFKELALIHETEPVTDI